MKSVTCSGLALALWISLCGALVAAAQQSVVDLSLNPNLPQRFLLLRNGAVFAGRIEAAPGRYSVQIDAQTTVNLDANRVWVIADSKQELFEFRRARVPAYDQEAQFELWQWCLQNELLEAVDAALPDLRQQGFPASRLRSLELGLAQARGELPVPMLTPPPQPIVRQSAPGNRLTPTGRPGSPGTAEPRSVTAHPTAPEPLINSVFSFYDQPGFNNDSRIEEAIATSIKQTAVDQFNDSVHWALVQSCAGCHYPENEALFRVSAFALEIPGGPNKATLEQTRHNLEQLRPLINRDNPGNSRLLSLIAAPHGGQKSAPVAPDSEAYRQITQWVFRSGIHQSGAPDDSQVVLAGATMPDVAPPVFAPTNPALPDNSPLLPVLGPQIDPQRPYDPAPFNRHFHPEKIGQTAATPPSNSQLPVATAINSSPQPLVAVPHERPGIAPEATPAPGTANAPATPPSPTPAAIRPPATLPRIPRR